MSCFPSYYHGCSCSLLLTDTQYLCFMWSFKLSQQIRAILELNPADPTSSTDQCGLKERNTIRMLLCQYYAQHSVL